MAIEVTCPKCDRLINAPDSLAGQRVKCPQCGVPLTIPKPLSESVPGKAAIADHHAAAPAPPRPESRHEGLVTIKNPLLTGFLLGLGLAAAFSVAAVLWFVVTSALAHKAMEKAQAEVDELRALAAANQSTETANQQRAESMVAEDEAERREAYIAQTKAQARQDAIEGLKVDVATIDDGKLFISLRNTSYFAIKSAKLRGVVTLDGKELDRGEFDAEFERRILQDQIADVELPATVLWKSMGDSITNDVDVNVEVVDITFGKL